MLIRICQSIQNDRLQTRRLLVPHIKDFLPRPQIFIRRAVTVQAPFHLQGSVVIHQRHAIYRSMTGVAAHSLIDMNAVIEVNEVWKIVNAGPNQRFPGSITFAYGLKHRRPGPNLRMTIHAGPGGRDASKIRGLNRSVAIAAVDAGTSNMVLMAKRHGLRPRDLLVSHVRRTLQLEGGPEQSADQEHSSYDRGFGKCVGTAMKNLHRSERSSCSGT